MWPVRFDLAQSEWSVGTFVIFLRTTTSNQAECDKKDLNVRLVDDTLCMSNLHFQDRDAEVIVMPVLVFVLQPTSLPLDMTLSVTPATVHQLPHVASQV